MTYADMQAAAEREVLEMFKVKELVWFDAYTETRLWLAAHRLKVKGIVRESVVGNVFKLNQKEQA